MFSRNRTATSLSFMTVLAILGVLTAGCNTATSPSDSYTDTESRPDLSRPQGLTQGAKTRVSAAAKLRPSDGVQMYGEISFHEQNGELVVVASASGMDPKQEYVSVLHERSPVAGDTCVTTGRSVTLGPWSVSKLGRGTMKVIVKSQSLDPLTMFASVSVQRVPTAGNSSAVVDACGRLVFFQ